jgi:hypothetical protein
MANITLYLVTNGNLESGQGFTSLEAAQHAMKFQLPGETLTLYCRHEDVKEYCGHCASVIWHTYGGVRRELCACTSPGYMSQGSQH